jgi:hypothetical protein
MLIIPVKIGSCSNLISLLLSWLGGFLLWFDEGGLIIFLS